MMSSSVSPPRVAMVAYTRYETDPRVRREAEALVGAGLAVDFVALRRPGQPAHEVIEGVDVFRVRMDRYRGASGARYIGSYLRFLWKAAWWLQWHGRRRRHRLIHVNTMPDFMAYCAWWPRRVRRLPLILDIHDTMPEIFGEKFGVSPDHWKIRLLRWQEVRSARLATRVLTSEHTKADLLARHGVPREKIIVLLNLPDPGVFGSPDDPPAPPPPGVFRMVYHGTLAERLGVDIALRALSHAREEMDRLGPWRFEILGEGDAKDGLMALCQELGLGDRVEFSGFVPVEDLPARLRGASLGVVPTRDQIDTAHMLPTKLLECVHLGIPVVVRPTLTVRHYFREDQLSLVDSDDPEVWGRAICGLRSDPERLLRQAELARTFARAMRWETHQRIYLELVGELLRQRWPSLEWPSGMP
jgi:glycosyltransferase involved in cell wall biosynthesis